MLYEIAGVKPEFADDSVWVAPSADVIGRVHLASNSSVWFNVTVRADNEPMTIGENTNIQDNSVLHSDVGFPLQIGSGVTVGHMVMIHGCQIDDDTLIGMGSTILNGAKIGKNCIVGANSLVTEGKEFPDGVLIVGSPAKVKRELTAQELAMIKMSASHYAQNAQTYASTLKQVKNH
ncbi:MAG: gamma carbonic anhydrase family protein [Kordiimonadaceae bacterium]|nr:gamma carbonic anhydrase family protein [Kordiimonadaceae bacterium]